MLDEAREKWLKLREQMRAARVRLNGGVDIVAGDPLAIDKRKAANSLKKVGRTLDDLPPDWDKLRRLSRIPGERSRQSEFYRVFGEGEEEIREAERLRELEKRGRPENYDRLPVDERHRVDAKIRKQKSRAKTRTSVSKPPVALLPVADIAPSMLSSTLTEMSRSLKKWVDNYSTPLSRQLRNPERQKALIRVAAAYARYCSQHHRPPSHAQLAKWLHWSEGQARRRLDRLKSLYAPGGPWAST